MLSPTRSYPLEQFAGSPGVIERTATHLTALGEQMRTTAAALDEIGSSAAHQSMGTDALAEEAEGVHADLLAAGVRYEGTGDALLPYASALRDARLWMVQHEQSVRDAEMAYQTALSEQSALSTGMPLGGDIDQHQQDVQAAAQAVTSSQDERDALWGQYETVVDDWRTAYDLAADGVAEAMDLADNDDGMWDVVAGFLTAISVALIVLAIVALFVVSSPWSTILLAASAVLATAHLAGTVYLYANGKASVSDIVWSVVGLATLGFGAYLSKGAQVVGSIDDFTTIGRLVPGAPGAAGSIPTLAHTPITVFTNMGHGSRAAQLVQYGDDIARMGNPMLGTLSSIITQHASTFGSLAPGIVNWFTSFGVGVGSTVGLAPSFGRP